MVPVTVVAVVTRFFLLDLSLFWALLVAMRKKDPRRAHV
jgi:hypothetical protein